MARGRHCDTSGRGTAAVLAILLAGAVVPIAARCEVADGPTFTAGRCSPGQVSPHLLPRVRCGTVAVPRDHGHPDRGTCALAVGVVASATQPSRPDRDLNVSGDPGGPLTVHADAQGSRPLAPDRDLRRRRGEAPPGLRVLPRRSRFGGIDLADFGETVAVEDLDVAGVSRCVAWAGSTYRPRCGVA